MNYYFLNERSLAIVACYALKLIRFNSLALAKCRTLKNSFIELVFEVLDEIILENELLEQNIYLLLVDRGYVASIDEFYQINGFEAPPVDCLANIKERKEQ